MIRVPPRPLFLPSYDVSNNDDGYNSWKYRTTESLPDGNVNTVYSNAYGEVMLKVFDDTTLDQEWRQFFVFDDQGRIILQANPSAVTGYNDSSPDLLVKDGGNYTYLDDSHGLIVDTSYYDTTTADENDAGGVAGYVHEVSIQQGESGTPIPQSTVQYFLHTGGGATVAPVATSTVYRNDDGTGAETTSYAYSWFSDSTRMQSMTVSLPTVSADQNGPAAADVTTTSFDEQGRPIWTKDGDGFIDYTAYDQATGAAVKTIRDVDTTLTDDFSNLPDDWETPAGGGLHLITQIEVDNQGRPTKVTDPNGNVTYTVYNDANHEVRTYAGWDATNQVPTGPTVVSREDLPGSYTETLTMSAAPDVDENGRPTGTEAIADLQTLSRSYTSAGGQVSHTDVYFHLDGVTYSTDPDLGTENVDFYRTEYGYDDRGRQDRVQSPTGTITRTVYDGLSVFSFQSRS